MDEATQTDREWLESKWERVIGYWQTLYEPAPFWVDMGEIVCVYLRATGVDQRSAYAEARRLTEARLEDIRQLEQEIALLAHKFHRDDAVYIATSAVGDDEWVHDFTYTYVRELSTSRRTLTRLQSILKYKKRGLKL